MEQIPFIKPRVKQGHVYYTLRHDLDGVMVTHIENQSDRLPYSISKRSIDYLTKPRYANGLQGINFDGLVMTDGISMKGLLDAVEAMKLKKKEQKLVAGCRTEEARAVVLSLNAGAHVFIAPDSNVDKIVEGVAYAYSNDRQFRQKVNGAILKYHTFANRAR